MLGILWGLARIRSEQFILPPTNNSKNSHLSILTSQFAKNLLFPKIFCSMLGMRHGIKICPALLKQLKKRNINLFWSGKYGVVIFLTFRITRGTMTFKKFSRL